jgi:hypothetical protein
VRTENAEIAAAVAIAAQIVPVIASAGFILPGLYSY